MLRLWTKDESFLWSECLQKIKGWCMECSNQWLRLLKDTVEEVLMLCWLSSHWTQRQSSVSSHIPGLQRERVVSDANSRTEGEEGASIAPEEKLRLERIWLGCLGSKTMKDQPKYWPIPIGKFRNCQWQEASLSRYICSVLHLELRFSKPGRNSESHWKIFHKCFTQREHILQFQLRTT